MKPALITLNVIVLTVVAVLTYYWRPAGFAFIVIGPLAILGVRSLTSGGVSGRAIFVTTACVAVAGVALASYLWNPAGFAYVVIGPIVLLGVMDMAQTKQAIRRNFPVIAHARYLMEGIRPEVQQYFVESNSEGRPFHREDRSAIYQRAKGQQDTLPFGTQRDVYATGYEWINHSLAPKHPPSPPPRVVFGQDTCQKPYSTALLNISAMSFGSLSGPAIEALNLGAKRGGFAHNTGEGSISPHHLQGGDLIWQIGTGYFGCRTEAGGFDAARFANQAARDEVRMIEIKLSQGAKPGHGGILPAAKITPEIAAIRNVPLGGDVISPPAHTAFSTPRGLIEYVARLRELSGGKPVGFKLCVGKRREFLAICKAMVETGLHPDFITVDGGEGGTGAAPVEFSNYLGCPLTEGLIFVHNALVGIDLRNQVRVIAAGKVATGFDLTRLFALGADTCNSARAMMMAVGCIQARKCNSNECPVGVATQNPALTVGLVAEDKSKRVERFQRETVQAALDLMGAAGVENPEHLRPWHVTRRVSPTETLHYGDLFHYIEPGSLLSDEIPADFRRAWESATADSFAHANGG